MTDFAGYVSLKLSSANFHIVLTHDYLCESSKVCHLLLRLEFIQIWKCTLYLKKHMSINIKINSHFEWFIRNTQNLLLKSLINYYKLFLCFCGCINHYSCCWNSAFLFKFQVLQTFMLGVRWLDALDFAEIFFELFLISTLLLGGWACIPGDLLALLPCNLFKTMTMLQIFFCYYRGCWLQIGFLYGNSQLIS